MRRFVVLAVAAVALSLVVMAPASAQYVSVTPPNVGNADSGIPTIVLGARFIGTPPDVEVLGAQSVQVRSVQVRSAPVRSLAVTGADVLTFLLFALVSIVVGTVLVRRARPRHQRESSSP